MRRVSMPRDALHGIAVHKTKHMEIVNKKNKSQHRNKSFKYHAEMFPVIIALTKNT